MRNFEYHQIPSVMCVSSAHLHLFFNTIEVPESCAVKSLKAKTLITLMLKMGHVWKCGKIGTYFNNTVYIFGCHLAVFMHCYCGMCMWVC
jgi:hypothetical protein